MNAISKRIAADETGAPMAVILPQKVFGDLAERLGLDLEAQAEADLRETRCGLEAGNAEALASNAFPLMARQLPPQHWRGQCMTLTGGLVSPRRLNS